MYQLHATLEADSHAIGKFTLCELRLHKDANYPWCILVPMRGNLREIHHMGYEDQYQLIRESSHLAEVMTSIFAPNTMNIAALGNMVAQLHIHHVARFEDDVSWPKSIWGAEPAAEYSDKELKKRMTKLKNALSGEGFVAG